MEIDRLREWMSLSPTPIHSMLAVSDSFHIRQARWGHTGALEDIIENQMASEKFKLCVMAAWANRFRYGYSYLRDQVLDPFPGLNQFIVGRP